ncbi:MAG: hypothetical protein MUO85_04585, partial [candidate division Zixibacteria bacterium]|nr:hypothetical protein [candidate division Zixibacteria bacterium]
MVNSKINSILLSLAMGLLLFRLSWAEEPKNNENFLREVVVQSLNQSFSEAIPQMKDTVYLQEEGEHQALWLLREELVSYLMQNKKEVFLFDSTKINPSFSQNASILKYHLTELKISYPKAERRGFLGKRIVTREGKVNAFFCLVNATNNEIVWQTGVEYKKLDKIDINALKSAENKNFTFLCADLPSSATRKYVEPALVTAVVGGLV